MLDALGIKSGEKLIVEQETKAIKVTPVGKSVVDQLVGSIKIPKSKRGIPYEKALEETKKIVLRKLAAQ